MKVRLLCIGKTQSPHIIALIEELEKRLPQYISFERVEIPDLKNSKNLSIQEIQKQEWSLIEKNLKENEKVVLLDETGKEMSSRGFSQFLKKNQNQATQKLTFVIGGAYGFPKSLANNKFQKLSLSQMTFTHQMIRLFFTEQLYRGFSILEGKPYHND